jgi:hypothetical protein
MRSEGDVKYRAVVRREQRVTVVFDEDEIEAGDSPQIAATEIADCKPPLAWDVEDDKIESLVVLYDDGDEESLI